MSEDEAGLRAWRHFLGAHALALHAIEARLKSAGQPPLAWYDTLLELDRAGGRLPIGELAKRAVVEPYNMTRIVDRLEAEGFIRRERATGDRRSTIVASTAAGEKARRQMWPHYRRAILETFVAPLSGRDAEAMTVGLKKVIARLRDQADSGSTE
jgi:DNA-binding MarR family transcriptional regulator